MKCIVCVNKRLHGKDLKTLKPIEEALEGAKLAVVIINGRSLCAEHYHTHLMDEIAENVRMLMGRK